MVTDRCARAARCGFITPHRATAHVLRPHGSPHPDACATAKPVHHRPVHHPGSCLPGARITLRARASRRRKHAACPTARAHMRPRTSPRRRNMRCTSWRWLRWTSARTGRRCMRRCSAAPPATRTSPPPSGRCCAPTTPSASSWACSASAPRSSTWCALFAVVLRAPQPASRLQL